MATKSTHHDLTTVQPIHDQAMPCQQLAGGIQSLPNTGEAEDVDSDELEDDDDEPPELGVGVDSVIGVSISKLQDDMKSPRTPAASKAQALDASRSYFDIDGEDQNVLSEEPIQEQVSNEELEDSQSVPQARSEPAPKAPAQPTSPSHVTIKGEQEPTKKNDKRSSFVAALLGSASGGSRQRSSSGSSLVDTLRRRVPALPNFTFPKLYGHSDNSSKDGPSFGANTGSSDVISTDEHRSGAQRLHNKIYTEHVDRGDSQETLVARDKDSQTERRASLVGRGLLRRTTSDQSLYLRKAPTGGSAFDDYTAFTDVSEMVNSRFKAITDSFQDSSFRRPRILRTNRDEARSVSGDISTTANQTKRKSKPTIEPFRISESYQASSTNVTSKHPILKNILSQLTGDLVIMGGYRGSILREAQPPNRQLWVPIKVGVNLRKADLEVGLTREDELRMEEKIIADGALSHIGPVDICRRLLKKCSRCPNVQSGKLRLHNYGYDWRLSPDLLCDKLTKFLESLPCNQPETPTAQRGAWLVSHSLGGLITRHVINNRPHLVAGVVYAGTPQNCVNILGPLRNGDDVLFSSRVLTAQVNFTLRTSYALLPQNGRCFINKQTGERYDVDFFSAKTWNDYRLTPCINSPLPRQRPEKRMSLIGSISEAISQPTKHSTSWFSSSNENKENEPTNDAKGIAEEAIDQVAGATEAVKPERPLSPTMADGSSRHQKPSVATTSTLPVAAATEYLERTLASVLQFKQELSHKASIQDCNAYPPAAILFSKNTPTVYGAFVRSREDIKYDDAFDDLAFAAGDGVVLASAAQLPAGYRCVRGGRIESNRGHVGLLGDLEGVGQCLAAVLEGRIRGVGVGALQPKA